MLVQQPATPIHVLESQLAALQHTKADMYELREHMAGLEAKGSSEVTRSSSATRSIVGTTHPKELLSTHVMLFLRMGPVQHES